MDTPTDDRRRFIGMGLMAAGAWAATGNAAEPTPAPAAAPAAQGATPPTYIVVYHPGPKWIEGKPLSGQPLREHGQYMLSLYRNGALRFAGGFADDSGGAAVFTAADDAAALAVVQADPAVTMQVFVYELRRWRLVDWQKRAAQG
jgi:uncharacterized protein YciI